MFLSKLARYDATFILTRKPEMSRYPEQQFCNELACRINHIFLQFTHVEQQLKGLLGFVYENTGTT